MLHKHVYTSTLSLELQLRKSQFNEKQLNVSRYYKLLLMNGNIGFLWAKLTAKTAGSS